MKITALEEYGLRCLIQLARHYKEGLSISEISRREGLSIQYVSKIMAILKKGGLVDSTRGLKGGYRLTQDPKELRLSDISSGLGGMMFDADFCGEHTGKEQVCVHDKDCSIRSIWSVIYGYMSSILDRVTLSDLLSTEEVMKQKLIEIITRHEDRVEREKALRVVSSKS